jgi:hypothetical protein
MATKSRTIERVADRLTPFRDMELSAFQILIAEALALCRPVEPLLAAALTNLLPMDQTLPFATDSTATLPDRPLIISGRMLLYAYAEASDSPGLSGWREPLETCLQLLADRVQTLYGEAQESPQPRRLLS